MTEMTDVLDKIDEMICYWREVRDGKARADRPDLSTQTPHGYSPADCYVDALQSLRVNICGELLL